MAVNIDAMFTQAGRLKSFAPQRLRKGRGSSARTQKTVSWPHEKLSPEELSQAGFYYAPTLDSTDNVKCFMCETTLDNWDEDDDPVLEHIRASPVCSWVLLTRVRNAKQLPDGEALSPTSATMAQARRDTFADRWPHDGKRGWSCQTERMVEGGWYYCPNDASDDYVKCAYCDVGVEGWKRSDKPLEIHRLESPDCEFLKHPIEPKRAARKGRYSKMSRQSSVTVISIPESVGTDALSQEEEDSLASTATKKAPAKRKAPKKGGRGKKAAQKADAEDANLNSDVRPEDDPFEVRNEQPAKKPRGRKRKSDQAEDGVVQIEEDTANLAAQAPPPKRRAMKTRSSAIKQADNCTATSSQDVDVMDVDVDVVVDIEPIAIAPKTTKRGRTYSKQGNKGKARAARSSSRSNLRRKPSLELSNAGAAAFSDEANIDGGVYDKEIEAGLNEPLSDEENVVADGNDLHIEAARLRLSNTAPSVEDPETLWQSSAAPARPALLGLPQEPLTRTNQAISATPSPKAATPPSLPGSAKATARGRRPSAYPELSMPTTQAVETTADAVATTPRLIPSTTTPSPSPQSSDAENQPPSSRPTIPSSGRSTRINGATRPVAVHWVSTTPVAIPPAAAMEAADVAAPMTPTIAQRDARGMTNGHGFVTTMPWTEIDPDREFAKPRRGRRRNHGDDDGSAHEQENDGDHGQSNDDDDEGNDFGDDGYDDENNGDALCRALQEVNATLSSPEKKLSVESWLLQNAQLAEERLRRECEWMVCSLERAGNRALQALEGIVVVD